MLKCAYCIKDIRRAYRPIGVLCVVSAYNYIRSCLLRSIIFFSTLRLVVSWTEATGTKCTF